MLAMCCLMAFFSCEHEISFDYPVSEKKVFFEGQVSNEGVFVRISETRPMTDSAKSLSISDAQVWIASDDGMEEQLYFDSRQQCFLSPSGLVGTEGSTYTMRAVVDGRQYEATSTMPPPAVVDSVFFRWVDVLQERIYFFCIMGIDAIPDSRNYYLCRLWREGELFRWNPRSGRTSVNGAYEYDIICNSEKEIKDGVDEEGLIPLREGDIIHAEIISYERDCWEFFQSLFYGQSTTANPITNIKGGAQGIFMAANITRPEPVVFHRAVEE